jgi:hypothetical protein
MNMNKPPDETLKQGRNTYHGSFSPTPSHPQIKYLTRQQCGALAQDLQIGECEVRQWFARRRMKFKRQLRNLIIQAAIPPALLAPIAG